jgi:tetratricopeptide (TPR) repeat protein
MVGLRLAITTATGSNKSPKGHRRGTFGIMSPRKEELTEPVPAQVERKGKELPSCTKSGERRRARIARAALWLVAIWGAWQRAAPAGFYSETRGLDAGASGMTEEYGGSLLVDYFQAFLRDHDVETFRSRVAARYTEETLGRILSGSYMATARRAAVLSLGLLGTFEVSNPILGRALADADPVARAMAEDALWAVWFRADAPENNQILERVRVLIGQQRLKEAEALATRLIAIAPNFAEAYNQRAFAYFLEGRLAESASDCEQVLTRNPFHIGAIEGLAKCQFELDRPQDALKSLRRALKLRPHNDSLREMVRSLQASIELNRSR